MSVSGFLRSHSTREAFPRHAGRDSGHRIGVGPMASWETEDVRARPPRVQGLEGGVPEPEV